MRPIDFFECSACCMTFLSGQNAKRHVSSKCKQATIRRVPMQYTIIGDRLDVVTYLLEDTTIFPKLTGNRGIINSIVETWGEQTIRRTITGEFLSQLTAVFHLTWSKENTALPRIRNVFRSERQIFYATSEQILAPADRPNDDPPQPPSRSEAIDVTRHRDTLETYQMLAYELFVMHRAFILDTKFAGSKLADVCRDLPTTPWQMYHDHPLNGVPGHIMASSVTGYEDWMSPMLHVIRQGIPTHQTHGYEVPEATERINVSMCPACGWSHPESAQTKRHMLTCRHMPDVRTGGTKSDPASETTTPHEVKHPDPIKMTALARRFDQKTTRLMKRKRVVDEPEFTLRHIPACGNTERLRRTYTQDEIKRIMPYPITPGNVTGTHGLMEAYVIAFNGLFGKDAIDPRFQSFFRRRGTIRGFTGVYDDEARAYTPSMVDIGHPVEMVVATMETILAFWMTMQPSSSSVQMRDIMESIAIKVDGVSFVDLETNHETVQTDLDTSTPWQNTFRRLMDCVPRQTELRLAIEPDRSA